MRVKCAAILVLFQTLQCLALDDTAFSLFNKASSYCLATMIFHCPDFRWTSGNRLMEIRTRKCLGAQGKSVGSEVSLYECDEASDLQKWECRNETVLAMKGQELYIKLNDYHTAELSNTIGPNNHFTIFGTSSGACSRTFRVLYTIEGNAAGRPCMFPFYYKNKWYSDCTTEDSPGQLWCAVETKYENELWGYCPSSIKTNWKEHITTGAYYQLNTGSALTWLQAEASCKQQSASLLAITDPHEQAYIKVLLEVDGGQQGYKLWNGLTLDQEHGWKWSNGNPYRYLNWDSGHPLSSPGHSCGILDGAVEFSWQSSKCNKKLGYICKSKNNLAHPTEAPEAGFCSRPWIPYNGHCFQLYRTQKSWSDAQLACRKEGGDLVSIRNVEDQSFVISQLGYESTDELWIGLNDMKTEGLFDWSDHSDVRFTSWEFGEPAITTDQEDCVLVRRENGNWADRACKEKHGFICMKTSASEPSGDEVEQNLGCKTGWKRHGSYCYFVGTETKTFDEAKDNCKSTDSYLADVSTGVDNAFLVSLVGLRSEKHFWLGLSNQKNHDFFVWTNTDSVRFTHWNAEMPGHRQGCVAMATGSFAGLWDVLPCTNKEKYICKHMAEGAVLTPAPPTVPSPKCADGWSNGFSRNICYKLYSQNSIKKTWYEARDYCRAIGGDLLSIHNQAELRALPYSYNEAWIGFSAPDPVTGYVWSDGSPVNFLHWEDGEPNNRNNVESCVEFKPFKRNNAGSWNDVHCEKYNNWFCQMRAGVTPTVPPSPVSPNYNMTSDGWMEWNGYQYYINRNYLAMTEARHLCQQRHSDLVSINSEAESVFLWQQVSKIGGSFWIGLNVDFDTTYQWMDGSQVEFQWWDEGQPDFKHYDENCAVMRASSGYWHDYNCGFEFRSICKRSGSPPANTTVAPTVVPKGGCQLPWKKMNFKCYSIISDQNSTWDGARKKCQQMGGNLASISSRHVQVFLMSQMADAPTTDLWIGLHNLHGQLQWTDGQPKTYLNTGREAIRHIWYRRYHFYINRRPEAGDCTVLNTNPLLGIGKWIPKPCSDTNGFVCLRNVDSSLPDSSEPATPTSYIKILNDSIKVVPQQMSWDAAKMHCEGDGANLVTLRNKWTQAYVELLALNLKAPLWIGLNKAQTNGYFRYVDGWHMSVTQWGNNEPSTDRACVYVDVDGKWKTANCNQTISSVCMKSTDVPPTETSVFPGVCPNDPDLRKIGENYVWLPFNNYCYMFFTSEKSWADASASCVVHGGMLASIEDPTEQKFIQSHVKVYEDTYTSFWIGLFNTHKGEWLWLDKTVMDYTNWGESQPGVSKHGGIVTSDGTWKTTNPQYGKPYICKTLKVLPPKPSPSTHDGVPDIQRGHIYLAVVLVIAGIAVGTGIGIFLYKRSGHHLAIPHKFNTFDNPLFFNRSPSQSDPVDTSKLVENAVEENAEPLVDVM
ncbi:macrophage mannose receptor 1-like [Parambassis ranga]|uniref:Macrophage mannose receptor 1-like n=1 Tax=Parambassis ranga TaxID=210632 RepID=A0A6P7K381_9TELE|nr:macrophage mannose receptor 1-like [Parambassis ranga]